MLNRFRRFMVSHAQCGFKEPVAVAIILSNRVLKDSKAIGPRYTFAFGDYPCPNCGTQMHITEFRTADIPDGSVFPMHEERSRIQRGKGEI